MRSPAKFLCLLAACALLAPACAERPQSTAASTASTATGVASPVPAQGVLRGSLRADGIDPGSFDCVFVIGRRSADAAFPDLVKRLPAGPFPMPFELSAKDLMGVGSLRGEWHLTARLDRDGDAPASRGDWEGTALARVDERGGLVELSLTRQITEDGPASGPIDPSLGLHGGATGGTAGPLAGGGHGTLPAGHPPLDPHAGHNHAPGEGHDEPAVAPGADHGRPIVVELAPEFAGEAQQGVLFVYVRGSAEAKGMPIAVKRVATPRFPVTVSLTEADVPLAVDNKAELLAGSLFVTASLDTDGNVATKDGLTSVPTELAQSGPTTVTISLRRTP